MPVLEFIFSSFWAFFGTLVLIGAVGTWFPIFTLRGTTTEHHTHHHETTTHTHHGDDA